MVDKPADESGEKPTIPFDANRFPPDTLFYDRRTGFERREQDDSAKKPEAKELSDASAEIQAAIDGPHARPRSERRAKKERRRRIDPTTFEKQYTDDEIEFMNAMQRFKVQSGKQFPSHGEVLRVAFGLGYGRLVAIEDGDDDEDAFAYPSEGDASETTDF